MSKVFQRAFELMGMKIELISNWEPVIRDDEYFMGQGGELHSLLSNFNSFRELPQISGADFIFELRDDADAAGFSLTSEGAAYILTGPVKDCEKSAGDKRAAIFGNMGFFSKVAVKELENRGIYSFHSTSFCSPEANRLFLVLGGSGAGKSSVLLKAQTEDLPVFGTELTHFKITEGKLEMLMGSLWQNCRMGNLVVDFPELLERYGIEYTGEGDPWYQYKSVDMSRWRAGRDMMNDPEIVIIFPRIESERSHAVINRCSTEKIDYSLYSNLADKVSPPSMLYKRFFIPSVDDGEAQKKRMKAAQEFKKAANITECWEVLANSKQCLNGII